MLKSRQLGNTKLKAFEIGLGCMGMSEFYGSTSEAESIATLHRALELGLNFFDTADMYGMGANEELLGKAFKQHWNKIIIATKCGVLRDPDSGCILGINGRPDYVKAACDASLMRLGVDVIDLYYLHRMDMSVPIEESVGAISDLIQSGKVRYIGLSEVSAATLQKAHQVHPITAVQSEYSLWTREPETEMIPLCERLQISFVPYSPLGRGFLTNKIKSIANLEANDYRKTNPRFEEENFKKNQQLVSSLHEIALKINCTDAQLALAWVLAKSPVVIPIPGTKRISYLEENMLASEIKLQNEEIRQLDDIFSPNKIAGPRYSEAALRMVDNKR